MINLFGVNIAQILAQQLGPQLLDCDLIVVTDGTRDLNNPSAPIPKTEVMHKGKGITDGYCDFNVKGSISQESDRQVLILAATFSQSPVPKNGDKITIEGETLTISGKVIRDAAGATYLCPVK